MAHDEQQQPSGTTAANIQKNAIIPHRPKYKLLQPPFLSSEFPRPTILAADPYTTEAYRTRTMLECASLSFRDIADGALPHATSRTSDTSPLNCDDKVQRDPRTSAESETLSIEMVICSFALHLIETPSELFSLLWELSTKCRWLVILAPHKKPDIKDGWGWCKWDVEAWSECQMSESGGEYLQERVHCRIYRSLNI
ncbi:hypothetical protein AcW1_007695 [Taiwanofungus camphoratus]|nr:hypothetical protein AcW2_007245 [Antrodia cinnamomea]KAI0926914.1 hypothetical protein AcV5_007586 [Antrodia cinnamomea]KAI0947474.1 hypothetical protein AcV7_009897 [Antrodia cinnamomea]KAI0953493.1 hypothetical protein AcW1_007695 [Antrodia cinnamomea]